MDLPHLLYRSAARYPDNQLWVSKQHEPMSYRTGAERVSRLANAIRARSEQKSRVAILSTNRFEGLESYLATLAAGNAAVTLNPRGHVEDYRHALVDSGASIVFCDYTLVDRLQSLRDELPKVRHFVAFGGEASRFENYDDWIAGGSPERPDVLIDGDDPAWVFYTSGTTGKPKGAIETHRNLLAMTRHFMLELGADLTPQDVMLHLAPISHGSCSVALPHLAVGAANAFPTNLSFDPAAVLETIEQLGATTTMLAPTMIRMLLDTPEVRERNVSSLKTIVYGAAPMPVADLKEALDIFGPVFVQFYGQAEAAANMTCLPKSEHRLDDPDCIRRLASAGRETFATRLRIVDPKGEPLPPGETGEIVVRGDLVMAGYWERPEATAETIKNGWLHTGDAGYLDEDGYLFITDRIKDMIISGGSNIYAREIEDVLGLHPAVSEVAVIGIPDQKWGEVVAAVIVKAPGAGTSAEEIKDFARANMASYKKPHHVWFVESMPLNSNGKILKRELRSRFADPENR